MLAVDLNCGRIVVEDRGDVVTWEFVLSITNEDAGLAHTAVPDYDQLDRNCLV